MRRRHLLLVLLAFALACTAKGTGTADCVSAGHEVSFGRGATLRVDVADTDAERERGLMGVAALPEMQGMAFVWDAPVGSTFWMKDTLIPLSIAFVGADGKVITILDMTPCTADPCPQYSATGPYVTAIEANQGWFARHGVEVGDKATLKPALDWVACS